VKIWTLSVQQEWLTGTLFVLALSMVGGGFFLWGIGEAAADLRE